MAKIAEIKINDLGMALRFDSQFYQPEYLIDTSHGKWLKIRDVLKKCEYGLSLAMNDEKQGHPMFKMDDIDHTFLIDDHIRYAEVSDSEHRRFKCKNNDVFFNRVNSEEFVGRTGIFKSEIDAVFASYLIRLQPNDDVILPQYLNIFLNSKYGQKQINRYKRRAVNQANVNAQELQEFMIAIPAMTFQEKIAKLVDNSWDKLNQSKLLYQQAEKLLLQELSLENFVSEWVAGYETDFDSILGSLRMDAEYFQPKYKIVEDKIKKYKNGWKYLPELLKISKQKTEINGDKIYHYIELADINVSLGVVNNTNELIGADLPSRARMSLQKGDVVVSSVEGSIGKVALIDQDIENLIGSTGFFVLRTKEFTPEVNLILCKSPIMQLLLAREAQGTILTAIPNKSLERVVVPFFTKEIQKKITSLVQESHKALYESRQLLGQAKREVEETI
ncbi:hypothetical protein CO044_02350 [Candidatus Peregrinibacteria bacterium CG_4_9_14_0_2_um_filter_38_9]|nr:MAG: hypothetical protein CO044_02350 [Candidatus Peregrinibacteria bacterium CG_4_9_14_0_2_um_filter_38_9]